MRCAEWALYQLFRIYDPATTTDKLQPFFPPLEPLQSINLRAALYRCLNELKKDGVLGRETVLRKTMLDDCQGDKFFEVCLTFSAIVMRKAKIESQHENGTPLAQKIGTAQSLGKRQRESMLPLAIAHKAALSKVLAQREHKRRAYASLGDLFGEKELDLEQRKVRIAELQQSSRDRSQKPTFAQDVLEKSWVGSNQLRTALMDGDVAAGGDGVLTKPFDSLWQATEQNRLFSQCTADAGILEDLEKRARHQKRRLQKWQNFHERLMTSKSPKKSDFAPKDVPLRMDQHQSLTLRDMADEPPRPPPPATKKHKPVSVAKYDDILTAMREELRLKSANPQGSPAKDTPAKRPAVKRQSMSQDSSVNPPSEHHQRSHSQTAVPVRPGIHKRFSSRSRSYHQPKVISMKEILPLKSEIFSPLATKRLSSGSSSSPRSGSVASPAEDTSPGARMDDILAATSRRMQQDNELTAAMEASLAGDINSSTPSRSNSGNTSPMFRKVSYDARDSGIELPLRPSASGRNSARPNLADRTRMSMAFKSSDDFTSVVPEIGQLSPDKPSTPTPTEVRPDLERRSTLQERTRQSIINLPIIPQQKKTHTRSRTSAFPVNQFETPQKGQRRSTLTFDNNGTPSQRRDITPREELFDQDAEYASVFKARPKIALSPVISPYADAENGLAQGEASPLAALGDGEIR